jgi:HEAT repeat protein
MENAIRNPAAALSVLAAHFAIPETSAPPLSLLTAVSNLGHPEFRVREEAARTLLTAKEEAVPLLFDFLRDPATGNPEARHRARSILLATGNRPDSAIALEPGDRRLLAILWRLEDPGAVDLLAEIAARHPDPAWRRAACTLHFSLPSPPYRGKSVHEGLQVFSPAQAH